MTTRPRDVRIGPDRPVLLWHKRKWRCRVPECERKVFTESLPEDIQARARITTRAPPGSRGVDRRSLPSHRPCPLRVDTLDGDDLAAAAADREALNGLAGRLCVDVGGSHAAQQLALSITRSRAYGRIVSLLMPQGAAAQRASAKSRVPNGGTWMTCSPHPPIRTAARSRSPGSATLSNAPAEVAQRMTTGSGVGQWTAVLRRDRTVELCTPLAWFRTECTSSSTGTCVPCRSYCCSWVRPCCCFWARLVGKPERTSSTTRDSPSERSSVDETRCRTCHLLRAHGGDVGSFSPRCSSYAPPRQARVGPRTLSLTASSPLPTTLGGSPDAGWCNGSRRRTSRSSRGRCSGRIGCR